MARHKNTEWNLPEGVPKREGWTTHSWESIHAALLMDIRDELQALNRLFSCTNFLAMPNHMRAMRVAIDEMATDARRRKREVKARAAAKRRATMRKVA